MGAGKFAIALANRAASQIGLRVERNEVSATRGDPLLTFSNPRLQELRRRYARCDPAVIGSRQWHRWSLSNSDLAAFRGDNAYVWQRDGRASLAIGARYAIENDSARIFDRCTEDGAFGALTEIVENRTVSRDLVDAALELNFLDRHIGLSGKSVLDIGAGYGRLAHRATTAFDVQWACTDAIPVSTFLCEHYLTHRGAVARVVLLDQFKPIDTDVTVNVHSFTECTTQAVSWWLDRVRSRWLFIVPNAQDHGGTRILNSEGADLVPLITQRGFTLKACEPKYADEFAQTFGVQPTRYWLFEL